MNAIPLEPGRRVRLVGFQNYGIVIRRGRRRTWIVKWDDKPRELAMKSKDLVALERFAKGHEPPPKRTIIQRAYDHADAARLNLETAFRFAKARPGSLRNAKEQLEKALGFLQGPKPKCPHRNALVIIASPAPGVKAERWCPECGAHYGPIYTKKNGWKNQRRWHLPGSVSARAYVELCEEVRANEKRRRAEERATLRLRHFKELS